MERRPKTETLIDQTQKFLNPDFVYRFRAGPDAVGNFDEALKDGINCISLAHIVISEVYGVVLPKSLKCFEMFCDTDYFEKDDEIAAGDLVWFGVKNATERLESFTPQFRNGELTNWNECPVKHVGICVDCSHPDKKTILHATNVDKTNAIWTLDAFARHRRYAEVCGIRRLKM